MINIWLALRQDAEAELELEGTEEVLKKAILSHPDVQHIVESTKRYLGEGNQEWGAFSIYLDGDEETMSNVTMYLSQYEGKVVIGGAWNMDGSQVGTFYDEEGNLQGTPLYPIDMRMLAFMPDDVVYDESGVEVSRTPAVALKQINLMAGQKPRDFTKEV